MKKHSIKIGKTYLNSGYINPKKDASLLLGNKDEEILILTHDKKQLACKINRTANKNGSARIQGGNILKEYIGKNYKLNDELEFEVLNANTIKIIK
jgi:hypothetical protein